MDARAEVYSGNFRKALAVAKGDIEIFYVLNLWLGAGSSSIKDPGEGRGNGDGYGDGDGYGNGNGYGNGDGYGNGFGV